jgi:hypothetical protein
VEEVRINAFASPSACAVLNQACINKKGRKEKSCSAVRRQPGYEGTCTRKSLVRTCMYMHMYARVCVCVCGTPMQMQWCDPFFDCDILCLVKM